MYCSMKCKNKVHQSYAAQRERSIERKLAFVTALGGKCSLCGYDENLAALSFHHKSGKEYQLDARSLSNRGLAAVEKEIAKCELLCSNCHMKLHHPSLDLAKLSTEPTALTTELQARKSRHRQVITGTSIAENDLLVKKFERNLGVMGVEKETVVLGVSGGVDSIVMLDLFLKAGFKPIVAHMNHGIRVESDADKEFVKELANKYVLQFVSKTIRKPATGNLEEELRNARRKFLLSAANDNGAKYIALAHNADDQAETVIMNLVRGSSSAGLGGMKPFDGQIIRPLLDISRVEIETYAQENRLEWHEDKTNRDITYSRNYIRHQILPKLARLNPEYLANIGRSAELQRNLESHLKQGAESLLKKIVIPGPPIVVEGRLQPGTYSIKLDSRLRGNDEVVIYEVFGTIYENTKGDRKDLTLVHLKQLASLISNDSGTKSLDLPGNITATRTYATLDFTKKKADNMSSVSKLEKLELGGQRFGSWVITVEATSHPSSPTPFSSFPRKRESRPGSQLMGWDDDGRSENDKISISDSLLPNLLIRTRKPGDRITPVGMTGRKKLQDLFVDAKIDREKRKSWPIFVSRETEEIIWVPELAKSSHYIETENLLITAREEHHETQKTK